MDKKRRDRSNYNLLTSRSECKSFWYSQLEFYNGSEVCGIRHQQYQFVPSFGKGSFEYYVFNNLYISFTDVLLKEDFVIAGTRTYEVLELSILLEGEQIISFTHNNTDFVYEGSECYLQYIPKTTGKIRFNKHKRFKEIKIRISTEFIEKHGLDEDFLIAQRFKLPMNDAKFAQPIDSKTQNIVADMITDTRKGLLKRLFLESKVLELLSIQLDAKPQISNHSVNQNDSIVKKIYQIQRMITSNLTEQFTIPQLSREVGLNDFIVKKEFKRIFGTTIFEYAHSQRIQESKKFLLHSKKPIYEISELVGYKNATHFSAAFKKSEGITPRAYRHQTEASIG